MNNKELRGLLGEGDLMIELNNNIIAAYKTGRTGPDISKEFNVSTSKIYRILKKNGIIPRKKSKLELFKGELINKYKYGKSIVSLANEFVVSQECVRNLLIANSVRLRGPKEYGKEYGKKYNINENYFNDIDSEVKAYALGFILADGSLISGSGKSRSHMVTIEIQERDRYILDFINKNMCHNRPLYVRRARQDTWQNTVTLKIISDNIYNQLLKLQLGPNKSFNCKFPLINNKLIKHLIRGIFDGDGGVFFKTPRCGEVSFIGSVEVCDAIQKILIENKISCRLVNLNYYSKPLGRVLIERMSEIKKNCRIYL